MAKVLAGMNPVNKILFPAPPSTYSNDLPDLIWIPHSDDPNLAMPALLILNETANKFILYSHGNGDDLGNIRTLFKEIAKQLNAHVLAYEYSGYGQHEGNPSESELSRNIMDAYNFVLKQLNWPKEGLITWGFSMGSGPTMTLYEKEKDPAAILILQSPYTSIKDLAKELAGMVGYFITNRFDNLSKIENVNQPTLFIHGTEDTLIRCWHSEKLYEHARTDKKYYHKARGVGHGNFDLSEDILGPINAFFEANYKAPEILIPISRMEFMRKQHLKPPEKKKKQTRIQDLNISGNHDD